MDILFSVILLDIFHQRWMAFLSSLIICFLVQEEVIEGEGDELLAGGNLSGRRGALVPPKMLVTGDSGRNSSLSR
jgi:hypothetical protein